MFPKLRDQKNLSNLENKKQAGLSIIILKPELTALLVVKY
jgi:hypothetical protein